MEPEYSDNSDNNVRIFLLKKHWLKIGRCNTVSILKMTVVVGKNYQPTITLH